MPKGKHHHNPPKVGLTDYTVAGTDEGRHNATLLAINYEAKRTYIRTGRSLRRMCRQTAIEAGPSAQQTTRGGFPKRREKDDDIPSKRGVAFSRLSDRFKWIGDKLFMLHVTRGWKSA